MAEAQVENRNSGRDTRLNIDNVVASYPELGPTPPDGGYGWMIVLGAVSVQISVPSILAAYGIIILYLNLLEEYEENQVFHIWDKNIILVPIIMTVFWLLLEPWSRTIVLISNRPRVVSISGVLLMSAGIMMSNFAAESEENDVTINVFSGILLGVGASLTTQQTEILLKHYFRKKIDMIQKIHKTSIVFGYVLIPLVMGILCSRFGASLTLVIYAGLVIQMCFTLLVFTRPTYVVKALSQNYKILKEVTEDDDEDIYTSQIVGTLDRSEQTDVATSNNKEQETNVDENIVDDDQDENVIGTFNNANTVRVIETHSPVLARYESTNNPFGSNFVSEWDRIDRFVEPQDLYRETTIAADAAGDNVFTYEAPGTTSAGTARRTANTKKNLIVLLAVLKDKKLYAFTHILLSLKFTTLVFLVLFPAYVSQQGPTLDMLTVIAVVTVMHIGAMCLTIVAALFSSVASEKLFLRLFSVIAMVALITLCRIESQNWRIFFGMLAVFATNAMYVAHKPIFDNMTTNFDASVISIASNFMCALLILFIMLVHNYTYETCFIIAASLHFVTTGMTFLL